MSQTVRIPAWEVKLGMHVVALDRPWLGTPFLLQGFVVTTQEEIDTLRELCLYVDIEAGGDKPVRRKPRRAKVKPKVERIERRRTWSDTASLADEMPNAAPAHTAGLQTSRALYADIAAGRSPDMDAIEATVSGCVTSILRNPGPMELLSRLRNRDEYTSEHSLNVALLAIGFGRNLGLEEADLQRVGTAAMLHDVGKMRTPLDILNKPGRLDPDEAAIMRDHARHGFEILADSQAVPQLAVEVAHSHHESPDGSGYPRKLTAESISDFTGIVTLCDVYDAITSDRPYKAGRSSIDALKVIHGLRGQKFHPLLAEAFIRHIGLYPRGSIVELRSGEVGLVTAYTEYRHLPHVLMVRDADKQPMEPRMVDLRRAAVSQSQARLIRKVLANGSYGVRVQDYIISGELVI